MGNLDCPYLRGIHLSFVVFLLPEIQNDYDHFERHLFSGRSFFDSGICRSSQGEGSYTPYRRSFLLTRFRLRRCIARHDFEASKATAFIGRLWHHSPGPQILPPDPNPDHKQRWKPRHGYYYRSGSWQCKYVSRSLLSRYSRCFISQLCSILRHPIDSSYNNTLSKTSSLFEAGLLTQGLIVNIPDYQGSQAAFSSGLQAGRATLDSIRAVLSSSHITGIPKDADVAMWGYSGGSIATEWAAELQPSYAPELKKNIKGAAMGGTVVNLHNSMKTMNKSKSAGLGIAGLWGLYQSHKNSGRSSTRKCSQKTEQSWKNRGSNVRMKTRKLLEIKISSPISAAERVSWIVSR